MEKMIPVTLDKKFKEFKIIKFKIEIEAELHNSDNRTEIPLSEAINIAKRQLDYFGGSNDGSEVLMNANPIFE